MNNYQPYIYIDIYFNSNAKGKKKKGITSVHLSYTRQVVHVLGISTSSS